MKRDAPFEPIDGDFDKFIQELHKNSAHNAAINKKLAEQKLNGGAITLESPQQSFNKIRQQHKNTMSSITSGINECSQQITQASCAHNMFDNSASFGSSSSTATTNNNFGNYQNKNVRKTAPRNVAKETKLTTKYQTLKEIRKCLILFLVSLVSSASLSFYSMVRQLKA